MKQTSTLHSKQTTFCQTIKAVDIYEFCVIKFDLWKDVQISNSRKNINKFLSEEKSRLVFNKLFILQLFRTIINAVLGHAGVYVTLNNSRPRWKLKQSLLDYVMLRYSILLIH